MFGSGQWTIWEGYAAAETVQGWFRSNNIDERVTAWPRRWWAMRTFGMDEPMGCYDDIEQADAFVLWGSMAEIRDFYGRASLTAVVRPECESRCLSPSSTGSFELADNGIVFTPQSDLVIANYIIVHIQNSTGKSGFLHKAPNLRKGATDIGWLAPDAPAGKAAKESGLRRFRGSR